MCVCEEKRKSGNRAVKKITPIKRSGPGWTLLKSEGPPHVKGALPGTDKQRQDTRALLVYVPPLNRSHGLAIVIQAVI